MEKVPDLIETFNMGLEATIWVPSNSLWRDAHFEFSLLRHCHTFSKGSCRTKQAVIEHSTSSIQSSCVLILTQLIDNLRLLSWPRAIWRFFRKIGNKIEFSTCCLRGQHIPEFESVQRNGEQCRVVFPRWQADKSDLDAGWRCVLLSLILSGLQYMISENNVRPGEGGGIKNIQNMYRVTIQVLPTSKQNKCSVLRWGAYTEIG